MPEAEEDDAGMVPQKSFSVPPAYEVDEYGHLFLSAAYQGFATVGASRIAPRLDEGRETIMLEDVTTRRHMTQKERQQALDRWVHIWNVTGADADPDYFGDVVEDMWCMIVNGAEAPVVGRVRDLKCCECTEPVACLGDSFTCCPLCDELVHAEAHKGAECFKVHMQNHAQDHFFTGLRLREARLDKARAEQRGKAAQQSAASKPAEDQDTTTRVGSLPPRPGKKRDLAAQRFC